MVWWHGGGVGGESLERRTGRRSKKPSGQPFSSNPKVFASSLFCEVASRRGEMVLAAMAHLLHLQ